MTLTATLTLSKMIGEDNADVAVEWFRSHLRTLASLELANGNPEGAVTLERIALELGQQA